MENIYEQSEKYPHGRVQRDSIARPIRSKRMAKECAFIMKNMTGDDCFVEQRSSHFYLVRTVSDCRQVLA